MHIYNTLERNKEPLKTVEENTVKIYICGPTVYNYIHIGNARPLVVFDTLRRYLLYRGYDVKYVQNYTDIDDKIIDKAKIENVTIQDISERYIKAYEEDSYDLNVLEDHTIHPRATEYIDEMIEFITGLIDMDAAYEVEGDVYFDVSKAKNYGDLSKRNIDDLISGARIEINEKKRNPLDFVMWKAVKDESEPGWKSPWGLGRPGWHIECSVMSQSILGDTIDIHAGGADLQFPHHENEIAQSETLTGKKFANHWMHNAMIFMDDIKMSKSLGNIRTVHELKKIYDPEVLRFWLISAHYRNPINFTEEAMDAAKNGLERLYTGKNRLERLLKNAKSSESKHDYQSYINEFNEAMSDDLNTADGISVLFNLVRFANLELDENSSKEDIENALRILNELAEVLGLLFKKDDLKLDEEIQALINEREKAREDKNYDLADKIRDDLASEGIILKDTPAGVIWEKK